MSGGLGETLVWLKKLSYVWLKNMKVKLILKLYP